MEKRLKIEEIFSHPWVVEFEKEKIKQDKVQRKNTEEQKISSDSSLNNLKNSFNPWNSAGAGFYKRSDSLKDQDNIQRNAERINTNKDISETIINNIINKEKEKLVGSSEKSPEKIISPNKSPEKSPDRGDRKNSNITDFLEISK